MPGPLTDAYAWVVVAAFGAAALAHARDHRLAREAGAAAWAVFAGFWLVLAPHFALEQKSFIEGLLSLAAVPACLYAGKLLYEGRDSLFVLSRAVAAMGLFYLPFQTIPAVTVAGVYVPAPRQVLIRVVTDQTAFLMGLFGYQAELVRGDWNGYLSTFRFVAGEGHRIEFTILLACTGLGSIAIFAGLIAAVRAPLRRKLRALAVVVPVIWVLNLLRTTFIGIAFGKQLLQVFVDEVMWLFGTSDPYDVSFFVADRIIAQSLALVTLVGVTYLVVRELPELLTVVEDVLYMATGEEYDLAAALDLPAPDRGAVRADGGDGEDGA